MSYEYNMNAFHPPPHSQIPCSSDPHGCHRDELMYVNVNIESCRVKGLNGNVYIYIYNAQRETYETDCCSCASNKIRHENDHHDATWWTTYIYIRITYRVGIKIEKKKSLLETNNSSAEKDYRYHLIVCKRSCTYLYSAIPIYCWTVLVSSNIKINTKMSFHLTRSCNIVFKI